ncbi:hypothetical protein BAE44_0006611, partial [Dichanthelium oligosanthes]
LLPRREPKIVWVVRDANLPAQQIF